MQGFKRKLVYACLFEGLAIIFTTVGLSVFAGHDSGHASAAAVAGVAIAVTGEAAGSTATLVTAVAVP